MRSSFLPLALALLAGIATAIPTPLGPPQPYELIAAESPASTIGKRNVGGVRLCTGVNWTGECWDGIYPLDVCIDLNDYAGHVLSFRPDEDTECLLMQGRCDANADYADLEYNSTDVGDLSALSWIGQVQSYLCLTPLSLKM